MVLEKDVACRVDRETKMMRLIRVDVLITRKKNNLDYRSVGKLADLQHVLRRNLPFA